MNKNYHYHYLHNTYLTYRGYDTYITWPLHNTYVTRVQGSGRPRPSVTWAYEGQAVKGPRHMSVEEGEFLIVMDVRPSDTGAYTCSLTNTYGVRSQTMQLSVFDGKLKLGVRMYRGVGQTMQPSVGDGEM